MTVDGNLAGGAQRFTVGAVISATLSALFANLFRFLAVILAGLVPIVLLIVGSAAIAGGELAFNVRIESPTAVQAVLLHLVVVLCVLAYFMILAALTYGTLQHLRGQRASIGACLSVGLRAAPRVFLASLLLIVVLGLLGGLVLLVLGSLLSGLGAGAILISLALVAALLYMVTLLWVYVPAIVVERAGTLDCYGRSLTLTEGHRWKIFAILALITVANWVVSFGSQILAQAAPMAAGGIDIVSGLFFLALYPVAAAVGYYQLRAAKEGVAIDDVVRVFE